MASRFATFEQKYQALKLRDPSAEGEFLYCVVSTNVVCRPTCSSRLPLPKNIIFCENLQQALANQFRPCKRCKPELSEGWNRTRECTAAACLLIAASAKQRKRLDVDFVAKKIGLSKWHFCRAFKNYTGSTPRKFYMRCKDGMDVLEVVLPLVITRKFPERRKGKDRDGDLEKEVGKVESHCGKLEVESENLERKIHRGSEECQDNYAVDNNYSFRESDMGFHDLIGQNHNLTHTSSHASSHNLDSFESPNGNSSPDTLTDLNENWRDSIAGVEMCGDTNIFKRSECLPRDTEGQFTFEEIDFLLDQNVDLDSDMWLSQLMGQN